MAGPNGNQVDGQVQPIFQFVLDACPLQNRHGGITFYQEIYITASCLIVKSRTIKQYAMRAGNMSAYGGEYEVALI